MKPQILVTGGAGFIGSHIVDRLVKNKYPVSIIDDLSGGKKKNLNKRAKFFQCDLRDVEKTDAVIKKIKPVIVYHLAANAAENKAQFSPIDITSRNYNAFINTLVPSLKYGMKRIVVTSSIAVYGALQTPFKETDKPEPEDLYGLSKLMMEESLKVLSDVHGFEYVITRPHNVYGPRQNMTDPYRNVVTIFMNALMKKEQYYIYGDGKQRRCFSYIDEVADAIYDCGFNKVNKKIFNVGSDKDYSLNELSELIQKVAKLSSTPIHIADRPQEVKVAISDHRQAKKYLKYKDKTSLEEGIKATWLYAKKCGPQAPEYSAIEIDSPKVASKLESKSETRMKLENKFPRVSVVMSNYNGLTLGLIPQNLEKILANNYPNLEVLFVDNASTDASLATVKKKFGNEQKLKIIKNPLNMYSQGLNLGIKNATGNYVAFFNNDAFVKDGYFQKFVAFLEKNQKIGLAQGKLLAAKDHGKVDSVGETMDNFGNPVTIGSGEEDTDKKYNKVANVLSVSGSCSILRKSIVQKVGYFDDDYGIGYEDLDLALRVRGQGYKIVYFPDVIVYHQRGSTDLSTMVKVVCRWHFNKNRIMTIMKNYKWPFIIANLPVTILIFTFAGIWEIVVKRQVVLGITRFSAMWWIMTHLSLILDKRKDSRARITDREMSTILNLMPKQQLRSFFIFLRAK